MAITFEGERKKGAQTDNKNITRTSRIFTFHFTNFESGVIIKRQAALPLIGSPHPDDPSLIARAIDTGDPNSNDKGKSGVYDVVVPYDNDVDLWVSSQSTRPWKLPPYNISYPPFETIIPFTKSYQDGDKNGEPSLPVLNSANDPIADVTNDHSWFVKFTYNLKTVNPNWLDYFLDTVNNQDVQIVSFNVPAGKGRLKQIQPSYQRTYDSSGDILYKYWKLDIEIEVKKQKWQKEIMDQGLNVNIENKKYRIYTDNDGNFGSVGGLMDGGASKDDIVAVDEPLKLDGEGGLLNQSLPTAVYLPPKFDKFFTNWKPLSFPKTVDG